VGTGGCLFVIGRSMARDQTHAAALTPTPTDPLFLPLLLVKLSPGLGRQVLELVKGGPQLARLVVEHLAVDRPVVICGGGRRGSEGHDIVCVCVCVCVRLMRLRG
jgi:hypothetical protein